LKCSSRFTTYERLQPAGLFVIKKDQRREEFSRDKLLTGIRKACEKRPLPSGTVGKVADDIEVELYHSGKVEIPSTVIGDLVMERLKSLDHIAYRLWIPWPVVNQKYLSPPASYPCSPPRN
jgi:transcriptional repressor NrdR